MCGFRGCALSEDDKAQDVLRSALLGLCKRKVIGDEKVNKLRSHGVDGGLLRMVNRVG